MCILKLFFLSNTSIKSIYKFTKNCLFISKVLSITINFELVQLCWIKKQSNNFTAL